MPEAAGSFFSLCANRVGGSDRPYRDWQSLRINTPMSHLIRRPVSFRPKQSTVINRRSNDAEQQRHPLDAGKRQIACDSAMGDAIFETLKSELTPVVIYQTPDAGTEHLTKRRYDVVGLARKWQSIPTARHGKRMSKSPASDVHLCAGERHRKSPWPDEA